MAQPDFRGVESRRFTSSRRYPDLVRNSPHKPVEPGSDDEWYQRDERHHQQSTRGFQRSPDTGNYRRGLPRRRVEGTYHYARPAERISGNPLTVDVRLYGFDDKGTADTHMPGSWQWPIRPGPSDSQTEPHHMSCVTAARRWFNTAGQHRLDMTCSTFFRKINLESEYPVTWL